MQMVTRCLMAFLIAIFFGSSVFIEVRATTKGDWEYVVDSDKTFATITGYTGKDANVKIPSKLGGAPVRKIGPSVFECNSDIVSVNIPNSIWYIEHSAFGGCPNLTTITGAKNVVDIYEGAFENCLKLSVYPFSNKNDFIGYSAFRKSAIRSVSLTDVSFIDEFAFEYCNGLTSVTIPDGCNVRMGAFAHCESLASVKLGAVKVEDSTITGTTQSSIFSGCTNLVLKMLPLSMVLVKLSLRIREIQPLLLPQQMVSKRRLRLRLQSLL